MNNEPAPEGLSAELEVRIVAFLLGEASDFEREEIERLIEERSDVREFKNQMQEMHGLLGHAAGGVPLVAEGDDAIVSGNTDVCGDDWKLSQDKRADVLALFDDQVPGDPISLADVGSESLLGHPDSRSVRAGSRFAGSGFAGGGFAGLWGRLPRQFRSVTRNHHWVSGIAASLLLVLGLSGFWYMNSRGFVVTSSQAMVDSAVMRSPTSASAAPMFEDSAPSDGSGDMDEQWHATGKERPFDSAETESEIVSEMAEVANPVELGANMGMGMDQGVSGNAYRSMERGGYVEGVDVGRESDAKAERSSAMSKSGAIDSLSENLALEDARKALGERAQDYEKEEIEQAFDSKRDSTRSGSRMQSESRALGLNRSGAQPPVTQSVSPRSASEVPGKPALPPAPTIPPTSQLYFGEMQFKSGADVSLGKAVEVEENFQLDSVEGADVAGGRLEDRFNQRGGGMGSGGMGGMGGGGMGGMGGGGGFSDGAITDLNANGNLKGNLGGEMLGISNEDAADAPSDDLFADAFGDVQSRQMQQQGQQQSGGFAGDKNSEVESLKRLESAKKKTSSADPFAANANRANAAVRGEVSGSGPTSGVPALSQPAAAVNGPGPGVMENATGRFGANGRDADGHDLGGLDVRVQGNVIKGKPIGGPAQQRLPMREKKLAQGLLNRLSGPGMNDGLVEELEEDDGEVDKLAPGRLADSDTFNSRDALERDFAKDRELSLRGRKRSSRSAVPDGFPEMDASVDGFSTFSLHVSDVSFKLAQAALAQGEWPDASRIRSEEFLNAFDYGDPMPTQDERVSCRVEQSIHPFLQQRNLVRVAMRTAAAGRASTTPLKLTFLLDNSGSMERIDRQQTVRRAFAVLTQQLQPMDQVTLISFARQPRLLADRVSGKAAESLLQAIDNLPSEGGTNLESALGLAFEKALEQYHENAQNRIILLTDGAVNLGDASPERLADMIIKMRDRGIAFDAAGISADGLNDEILEALTRKGDGRYYLLDSLESVNDGFAKQIAGALRPAAKNVKIQVEFNPQRVGKYKLLGFEKHRLKKEDFRNDAVDAAEMAAAEAGVALYQVQVKPDGYGDIGTVSVRFRDLESGRMVEEIWPIPFEAGAPRADLAAPSMKVATAASLFAAKLKGGSMADVIDLKELASILASLPQRNRDNLQIRKLELMIRQARQINGE